MKRISIFLIVFLACVNQGTRQQAIEPLRQTKQTKEEVSSLRRINFVSIGQVKIASGLGEDEVKKLFAEKLTANAGIGVDDSSKISVNIDISDYKELVGSQIGAISPASIKIRVQLVENGKPIWSGAYVNAQAPLSENFLSTDMDLRKGFVSGRDLLELGFNQITQDLGEARMKAFLK